MLEAYKLFIPDVPSSYEGKLYFILGPGLGDTVNDFRLLHEVLSRYPNATPIVYVDPRWKSLYSLLPEMLRCTWRYHVAAPSGELAGKNVEQSYSEKARQSSGKLVVKSCGISKSAPMKFPAKPIGYSAAS